MGEEKKPTKRLPLFFFVGCVMYPTIENPEGCIQLPRQQLRPAPGNFSHTDPLHAPTTCVPGANSARTVVISLVPLSTTRGTPKILCASPSRPSYSLFSSSSLPISSPDVVDNQHHRSPAVAPPAPAVAAPATPREELLLQPRLAEQKASARNTHRGRNTRQRPLSATALLHHLPAIAKLRPSRVEAAVSAATTDQPFPRLHTRRKLASLCDRPTRPP